MLFDIEKEIKKDAQIPYLDCMILLWQNIVH